LAQGSSTENPGWRTVQVHDDLVLRTLPGVVDYLADALARLPKATVTQRWHDAVRVQYDGVLGELADIPYFSSCAVVLRKPTEPESEPGSLPTTARVTESLTNGVLAVISNNNKPVTFRVGDIPDRWATSDALTNSLGWINDPRAWSINIVSDHNLTLCEVGFLHTTQRYGKLQRLPASTTPVIAAVLVRLAKITDGATVVDPFCGAATNLLHASVMARPGLLLGMDRSPQALVAAQTNLDTRGLTNAQLVRADATHLPLSDGSIDRIIANLPFGKRVGSHTDNQWLYPQFMAEVRRVLSRQGRAILLTEDKRLFRDAVQRTHKIRVIKEILLESGGAHPSAYVVVRRGNH
jgi:tRNA (guanine6-N2)-methyltransferase